MMLAERQQGVNVVFVTVFCVCVSVAFAPVCSSAEIIAHKRAERLN